MRKINNKCDLPEWFSLNNYSSLCDLNDELLFNQLSYRSQMLRLIDYSSLDEIIGAIKFGEVVNDGLFMDELESNFEKDVNKHIGKMLGGRDGIEPISISTFLSFSDKVDDYRSAYTDDEFFLKVFKDAKQISLLDNDYRESIHISVDLTMNDELLIQDFSSLLQKWREMLGVKVTDNSLNLSWLVARKRILDYCILPLIDLRIWELKTNSKVSNGVLAVTLFPNGNYDSINIAQTIKPFLDKLLDNFSMEKYRREIYPDSRAR